MFHSAHGQKDGNPTYIVAVEDYISNTDESEYSFYAYDVDGNKLPILQQKHQHWLI